MSHFLPAIFCNICDKEIEWLGNVGQNGEYGRAYHLKDDKKIHPWCDQTHWAFVQNLRESRQKVGNTFKKGSDKI